MKLSLGWVFAAFLADLFSLFILSDMIGAWWAVLWVLGAMALGVFVILDAGDTLRSLGGMFATPSERVEAIKETPWMLFVGVLFFIPGVLSDLLAIMFWLPDIRRLLLGSRKPTSPTHTAYTSTEAHQTKQNHHVVIEGEFVEKPTGHLPPKH